MTIDAGLTVYSAISGVAFEDRDYSDIQIIKIVMVKMLISNYLVRLLNYIGLMKNLELKIISQQN